MAARRLSKTLFFNRQNATSGQNPCVFTCILKDRPFYHWFFMVFAKYGLLGSIQGFPQDSQVRQRSSERPLWPSGPKVIPPWAQSCRGEFFGRVWTKTNDILPYIYIYIYIYTSVEPVPLKAQCLVWILMLKSI